MLKLAFSVIVLLGLTVPGFTHEYRGLHRRKPLDQDKHFYQHIESQQEKDRLEELTPYDFQDVNPEFSVNDVQQQPNDLLRFRSKVDRPNKDYDGKSKRHWRCKHRGDTGTKVIQSAKYGYSKRYWKCKYRTNVTQTAPDSSSSESQEYEPESLMDEIMDSIANP